MTSTFLDQLNTFNLQNDIAGFVMKIQENISNTRVKKQYTNYTWFLTNSMELIANYNFDRQDLNLLDDDEYQNILNTITKIINIPYYDII